MPSVPAPGFLEAVSGRWPRSQELSRISSRGLVLPAAMSRRTRSRMCSRRPPRWESRAKGGRRSVRWAAPTRSVGASKKRMPTRSCRVPVGRRGCAAARHVGRSQRFLAEPRNDRYDGRDPKPTGSGLHFSFSASPAKASPNCDEAARQPALPPDPAHPVAHRGSPLSSPGLGRPTICQKRSSPRAASRS